MTTADRKSPPHRIAELSTDLERLRGELTRRERDAESLQREKSRLQRKNSRLQRENDRLKQQIEDLKRQLDEARRAGRRQAAPFAKDRPQGRGRRPGRRAGAEYGRHGCRPRPARVDETHAAPVPVECPDCGGAVEVTRVASQYQEELPVVRPVVRRFDIEVGHCSQCQRRVQGQHVLQTSDALGAAGVQLGPGVVALVVELHTEMGVPLAKVAHLLRTTFGLQVTPGGLAHVLHRAARAAAPAYTELCEQVRNAPVVTPDETGWRVGGVRHWLWTFVTSETTVYAICPGRGFADAATVLGTDYAGVLVRDGWAPYRCYNGLHQTCLNHLLQRCKQLREDHPDSRWAGEVQAVLRAGLDLRDRCNAGELSEHGMATARGRLTARLGRLVDAPPPLDDAERFAAHLATEFPAVFLFLWGPLARRHQLARRTGHPARRGHPQGVRRQPHPPRRRHPAGPRQRRAHRPPTRPRPASADRRDVARRRTRCPRAPRPSAAGRVGQANVRTTTSKRDRSPRRAAATGSVPTALRSVATGLRPQDEAGAPGAPAHRGIATIATVEATPREHTIDPSNLVGGADTSSLQAHSWPVSIG